MKQLKLFTLLSLAFLVSPVFAQEETDVVIVDSSPLSVQEQAFQNKYYGMNKNYIDFTSDQKKLNDWSIGFYAGLPLIQGADLNTKISNGPMLWSYDLQGVLTKQITHAFGLGLQFNWGRTEQYSGAEENIGYRAHTKYWMWSLIGDVNLSNLLRRVDNKSRFAWALHAYGGIGTLQYEAFRRDKATGNDFHQVANTGGFGSVYINGGGGLRYKINQKFDVEAKAMYYFTGDEEFDGSEAHGAISEIEEGKDDGLFTFSLGFLYKIGKHEEHLAWADPLADIYPGPSPEELQAMLVVCAQGDNDDDGVCDDWDRELNTPAGARVDGAGRALDTDLDGVIDLYDKCVVVPGPADNDGCPLQSDIEGRINAALQYITFTLDSDEIMPVYYKDLDQVAEYLKVYPNTKFDVVGHTDTRASQAYNLKLSERRARAVIEYLVQKGGISANRLNLVAVGEKDLRYPECKPASACKEWKNQENRRVIFVEQR